MVVFPLRTIALSLSLFLASSYFPPSAYAMQSNQCSAPTTATATSTSTFASTATNTQPPRTIVSTEGILTSGSASSTSAPVAQTRLKEQKPPSKEEVKSVQQSTSPLQATQPTTVETKSAAIDEKTLVLTVATNTKEKVTNNQALYFPCKLPASQAAWISTQGLVNPGLGCYASSIMQCLFAIDPLMLRLYNTSESKAPIISGFQKLINNKINQSAQEIKKPLPYKDLYAEIIKEYFGNEIRQQDAHEFFTQFIGTLGNIGNLFHHSYVTRTICSQCGSLLDTPEERTTALSLQIPTDQANITLTQLFDQHHALEPVDLIDCQQCKKKTTKTRQSLINQLPAVFAIHLKRFNLSGNKIFTPITFPLGLAIKSQYLSKIPAQEPIGYTLIGVVIHSGYGINGGHYLSVIKNPGNQTWYECDDSNITKFDLTTIQQFANLGYWLGKSNINDITSFLRVAYTPTQLFYVRNDVMATYKNAISEADEKESKPTELQRNMLQQFHANFSSSNNISSCITSSSPMSPYLTTIQQTLHQHLATAIQTGNVVDVKKALSRLNNDIYANKNGFIDLLTQTNKTLQARMRNLQAIFRILKEASSKNPPTLTKKTWDDMVTAITAADVNTVKQLMPSFVNQQASLDGKTTLESHFIETYRTAKNQLIRVDQIVKLFLALA